MPNKHRPTSNMRKRVELDSLKVEEVHKLPVLAEKAEASTLDAVIAEFLGSQVVADLTTAKKLYAEAEELRNQRRALKKQADDLANEKNILTARQFTINVSLDQCNARKHTIRTSLKNDFLNHKDVAEWRKKVTTFFGEFINSLVAKGLASDARYQELEAEGIRINKEAEKLATKIAKLEKALEKNTKSDNRLAAEVDKKVALANSLEGGHHA